MAAENVDVYAGESLDDLQSRLERLRQEGDEVAAKIKEIKDAERHKVILKIKELVRQYELHSNEIFEDRNKGARLVSSTDKKMNKEKVVKYKNVDGQTWSGSSRGRKPKWVKELQDKGEDINKYLVTAVSDVTR